MEVNNTTSSVECTEPIVNENSLSTTKCNDQSSKGAGNTVSKKAANYSEKSDSQLGRDRSKAKHHQLATKKFKNGKDAKKNRKKFPVSPHSKKSKSEKLLSKQQSVCVDPLNLAAIIDRGGSDSPQNSSPIIERAHDFEPREVISTNLSDPLQLNSSIDDGAVKSTVKKKRKRKRRHTYHGEDLVVEQGKDCQEKEQGAKNGEVTEKSTNAPNDTSIDDVDIDEDVDNDDAFEKDTEVDVGSSDDVGARGAKRKKSAEERKDKTPSIPDDNIGKETMPTSQGKKDDKSKKQPTHFRDKDKKFMFGNYNRYYGYRNPNMSEDVRVSLIQRDWILGKDCLDIGCNVGHVALWIARHMHPKTMVGVDIDSSLVKAAQNNIRHYLPTRTPDAPCQSEFPISFALCHGPLAAPVCMSKGAEAYGFPYNITFYEENYVPMSDEKLDSTEAKFDTILCLSVTKWVHLNWGDLGLKRMFKKIFRNLRPGGRLVLEPQPYKSYKRKKNLTPQIRQNYNGIKLHPDKFIPYLLSKEVGFATSEALDSPRQKAKGFRRPMYVLTKSESAAKTGGS